MVERLVNIGVYFIPFYEIMVRMLPYVDSFSPDTRVAKMQVALYSALIIFLVQCLNGIKVANKALLVLIGYVVLSSHMWWYMPFQMNGVDMPSFWKWQPLFQCLVFFLMAIAVASYKWDEISRQKLYQHISWSSALMASYMILQYLGIEQFYSVKTIEQIGTVTMPQVAGSLGQPTIAAPFLVMALPFIINRKAWLCMALCAIALIASQSLIAISVGVVIALLCFIRKERLKWCFLATIIISLFVALMCPLTSNKIKDESNGRVAVWQNTLNDWKTTPLNKDNGVKYSITGVGLSVYDKVFHVKHPNSTQFYQAHNEYLEALYSIGIIGLIIALVFLVKCFVYIDFPSTVALMALSMIAMFTFIWHIAVYQWFSALFIGLILRREEDENSICFNN